MLISNRDNKVQGVIDLSDISSFVPLSNNHFRNLNCLSWHLQGDRRSFYVEPVKLGLENSSLLSG